VIVSVVDATKQIILTLGQAEKLSVSPPQPSVMDPGETLASYHIRERVVRATIERCDPIVAQNPGSARRRRSGANRGRQVASHRAACVPRRSRTGLDRERDCEELNVPL
jgi:hypothetical protein